MRILLDTCIVLDFLENREPFADSSQEILMASAQEKIICFITAKSLSDIHYLYLKTTYNKEETIEKLKTILLFVSILDTLKEDAYHSLDMPYSDDFEDELMIETAIREKIDFIITRDKTGYKKSPVEALGASAFINKYKSLL